MNESCPKCRDVGGHCGCEFPALLDRSTRFALEFGVNTATALEMIGWIEEDLAGNAADVEVARKLTAKFFEGLSVLSDYHRRQQNPSEMRMATACLALCFGFENLAGAATATEIGRRHGFQKQTVSKCLNEFLLRMGMEKLPHQRDDTARANMAKARINRLTQNDDTHT